jgi:UDPglucose 6-dehydrogenase
MAETRTIGIFGAGWVGLVTGGCFAELGHDVIVRDVVPEKIDALEAGQMPFHEPDLPDVLARNRERIRYTLDARDLEDADVLFICVQTPPTYSGDADLSYVWTALDDLPRGDRRQILVMKSTVPVGTGEKVRAALEARGLTNVGYVSNPEFLSEGRAVRDFMNPDRIVIGAFADEDSASVETLYAGIEAPVVRTDVASAEMIKLAANAFLMTRISFINEIANVCEAVGADVVEVARGIGLDHRLGPHFLRAGIGYGGSCFPKDSLALKQLASNSGYHFQLLAAVIEVNELQKRRVVQKLQKHLGRLRGKKVALLGLAFKAGTDDLREAPSLVLASRLLAEGAEVRAWDPVARPGELMKGAVLCDSVLDAVEGADAAVIVTEWDELRGLASEEVREAMARPLIIDGRNLLDPEETRAAGFAYEGIGRQSSAFETLPETAEPQPAAKPPVRVSGPGEGVWGDREVPPAHDRGAN